MKFDGRKLAEELYSALKIRVEKLKKRNLIPHLAVILVGENPASLAYVLQKQKNAQKIGAQVTVFHYQESVSTDKVLQQIKKLNDDSSIHGILIQRPLPSHINADKLVRATFPKKDIDGFHPESPFILPLPLAVMKILEEIHSHTNHKSQITNQIQFESVEFDPNFLSWLRSQSIVVLGKGQTGGGPIIAYLNRHSIYPRVIDSKTEKPEEVLKNADIIVSAVGRERTIKPETIKKGVILIGVGITRGIDGKLHGDYDEDTIKNIASYYTPTPGGVGPVNVAMLLYNLLEDAENSIREQE